MTGVCHCAGTPADARIPDSSAPTGMFQLTGRPSIVANVSENLTCTQFYCLSCERSLFNRTTGHAADGTDERKTLCRNRWGACARSPLQQPARLAVLPTLAEVRAVLGELPPFAAGNQLVAVAPKDREIWRKSPEDQNVFRSFSEESLP